MLPCRVILASDSIMTTPTQLRFYNTCLHSYVQMQGPLQDCSVYRTQLLTLMTLISRT